MHKKKILEALAMMLDEMEFTYFMLLADNGSDEVESVSNMERTSVAELLRLLAKSLEEKGETVTE